MKVYESYYDIMPKKRNLLGQQFHYLTVIEETDKRKNSCVVWKCLCKCGNMTEVTSVQLTSG